MTPISLETPIAPVFPYPLNFGVTGAAYTADTEAQVTAINDELQKKVTQYQAIIARLNALAQSGAAYKEMLNVTLTSLAALERASDTPPDLAQQASEMLRLAFLIKTHVEAIRSAGAAPYSGPFGCLS